MKEIRTIKMVEQTIVKFIANDGKEFDDEKTCQDYERRLDKEKCKKEFRKLNPILIDIPFTDWGCQVDVWKITLNNDGDIDIIADYFVTETPWCEVSDLYYDKPKEYPCTKILAADEAYVNFSNKTPEDVKNLLLEAAMKL